VIGFWNSIALSALLTAVLAGCEAARNDQTVEERVDLKLDEESAVKIAEIILLKEYGDHVLNQRPWKVRSEDAFFFIEGTFPFADPRMKGGVAHLKMRRSNCEIVEIWHEL